MSASKPWSPEPGAAPSRRAGRGRSRDRGAEGHAHRAADRRGAPAVRPHRSAVAPPAHRGPQRAGRAAPGGPSRRAGAAPRSDGRQAWCSGNHGPRVANRHADRGAAATWRAAAARAAGRPAAVVPDAPDARRSTAAAQSARAPAAARIPATRHARTARHASARHAARSARRLASAGSAPVGRPPSHRAAGTAAHERAGGAAADHQEHHARRGHDGQGPGRQARHTREGRARRSCSSRGR